ncbi:hypothetical protein TWF718_005858 [Orbilia javanica]|uniref:Uncharacterized protein n=1 Tax=Orbilia javanica TaxID=47235 RepID=A0AAN8RJR3_9PEZI
MKQQERGEPVKATFERFHKWAADVNVVVKDENYKRPRLGTGLPRDPHPPKDPQFHLKAVKGKRRRILMQDNATITGEFPAEDNKWHDVLADESDDSDNFKEPWYFKYHNQNRFTGSDSLEQHQLRHLPGPEQENDEFLYVCLTLREAIDYGFPVLPIMGRYVREGFRRRHSRSFWQWSMDNKSAVVAHTFWLTGFIMPIIWYRLCYPPRGTLKTKHGYLWPAPPLPKLTAANGLELPFHTWPPHPKQGTGWDLATIIGYTSFFVLNFVSIGVSFLVNSPWHD